MTRDKNRGYLRCHLKPLLEKSAHNNITQEEVLWQQERGSPFLERDHFHEREQFAFTQDSTSLAYQTHEWNYSWTNCSQCKWVLVCKEIPHNERSFLSRDSHSWQYRYVPSLSVTDITNTKYVGVQVYLQDKLSDKIKTVLAWKKEKENIFLFCFSERPTSRSQLLYLSHVWVTSQQV